MRLTCICYSIEAGTIHTIYTCAMAKGVLLEYYCRDIKSKGSRDLVFAAYGFEVSVGIAVNFFR